MFFIKKTAIISSQKFAGQQIFRYFERFQHFNLGSLSKILQICTKTLKVGKFLAYCYFWCLFEIFFIWKTAIISL